MAALLHLLRGRPAEDAAYGNAGERDGQFGAIAFASHGGEIEGNGRFGGAQVIGLEPFVSDFLLRIS